MYIPNFTINNNILIFFLGIHAREWIAPAATTYIIKQLVEYSGENEDLIDFYDFYILPVANPDG